MDVFDKFFKKFSYKFDKGYPDINNPKDMEMLMELANSLVKEEKEVKISKDTLKKLIDDTDLSDAQLAKLDSVIKKITFTTPIETYLSQKAKESNISSDQVSKFMSILDKLNIQSEFAEYIKNPVDLDLSAKSFTEQIPNIEASKLLELYRLMGGAIEGTVSIGPGEVPFSLLFKNVKKRDSKGDLNVGKENVELKASTKGAGAVIAQGYNRGMWGDTRRKGRFDDFVKSLGMEQENEDDALVLLNQKVMWPAKLANIYNLYTNDPSFNKNKFIKGVEDILSRVYNKSNWYPKGTYFDLNSYFTDQDFDYNKFRIALAKELVKEYRDEEGFSGLLLVDKNGNIQYLKGDEIINNIGTKIKVSGPSDDVPRYSLNV
jgi:hypothetical protein